jgi:hypothetical protein
MGGATQLVRQALAELGSDATRQEVIAFVLRRNPTVPENYISLAMQTLTAPKDKKIARRNEPKQQMGNFFSAAALTEEIGDAVREAARAKQKIATFHFQILKNAAVLENVHAGDFCRAINVPKTYTTEFGKMLAVARLMKRHGLRLG